KAPAPRTVAYTIDFAPVKPPDLPAGWTGKGNLSTTLLDEGRKALKASGMQQTVAVSPELTLGDDFFLELELGTLHNLSLDFRLIPDQGQEFAFRVQAAGDIRLKLPGESQSTPLQNP